MANSNTGTPSHLNLELGWRCSKKALVTTPMNDLANKMEEIHMVDTPKRRISWSSAGSASPCRPQLFSFKDGVFLDSPRCITPVFDDCSPLFIPKEQNAGVSKRSRGLLQRMQSMPGPSPQLLSEQENKLKSGNSSSWHSPLKNYTGEGIPENDNNSLDNDIDEEELTSKLDFEFTEPMGIASRCLRTVYETSPSPVKTHISKHLSLPLSLVNVRPSSSNESLDEMDIEMQSDRHVIDQGVSFGISQLITSKIPCSKTPSPFANNSQNSFNNENHNDTPKLIPGKRSIRDLFGGKRGKGGDLDQKSSPTQHQRKKRVSFYFPQVKNRMQSEEMKPVVKKPSIQRSHTDTEVTIMNAVQRSLEEPNLIGDFSKPHLLPLMRGKHQDLSCVSHQTIEKLMSKEFDGEIEKFLIVDCRYPYEFDGGHIKGALNIYTKESILQEFFENPLKTPENGKRLVLVFHCEFSSERGPNLSRFLRNKDREINKECYPQLYYPEIYLLEGGYKSFYENHRNMCEPQGYKPMLHKDHQQDMIHFRIKSKSWNGKKSSRIGSRLKF